MGPTPFADADPAARAGATRLFFDVDDTLTWHGQLPEVAVQALYKARAFGLSLVAVTGRSFAWAEMLVRLFPLDAAIAETGACAVVRDGARLVVLHTEPDPDVRDHHAQRRAQAAAHILAAVTTARLALDNPGRLYDTAFDLVESGPPVPPEDAQRIRDLLHQNGLVTSQSSVHINAWLTRQPFDKATTVDRLLRERFQTSLAAASSTLVYVGDSANDGPLFAKTPLSVGVANVRSALSVLEKNNQAPRYITDAAGGHGFAQVVNALVEDR